MSTEVLLNHAEPTIRPDDTTRRLHRIAGLGGVGAFLAWLGQPVVVTLMGDFGENGTVWRDVEDARWQGAAEAVVFSLIGLGFLFLVLATQRLIGARREPSVAATVGHVLGLVAAGSWFLVAGDSYRLYTSIGAALEEVTPDPELQKAVIEGTYHDVTGALMLFALAFSGWAVSLATAGRRAGVIGMPVALIVCLPLPALLLTLARPFSMPVLPVVLAVLAALVLGVSHLVRSRR